MSSGRTEEARSTSHFLKETVIQLPYLRPPHEPIDFFFFFFIRICHFMEHKRDLD